MGEALPKGVEGKSIMERKSKKRIIQRIFERALEAILFLFTNDYA